MGTTYNLILPVDPGFRPDDGVADRIKAKMGEGFTLACHLGFTPDVAFTREVTAEVKIGLHTYVSLSNETAEPARFAVVITDALRRVDGPDLSFTSDVPEQAMKRLTDLVGVPLRQMASKGLVIIDGDLPPEFYLDE